MDSSSFTFFILIIEAQYFSLSQYKPVILEPRIDTDLIFLWQLDSIRSTFPLPATPRVRARVGGLRGKKGWLFIVTPPFFESWRRVWGIPQGVKGVTLGGWEEGGDGWQGRIPSSSSRDSPLFLSSSALPPSLFPSFFFSLLFLSPLPNSDQGLGGRSSLHFSISPLILMYSVSFVIILSREFINISPLRLITCVFLPTAYLL